MEVKVPLFPRDRGAWFVWLFLVALLIPTYYFLWPYPQLNFTYENERWLECQMGQERCTDPSPGGTDLRRLDVRAPAYVADFTEMPLEVWVRNTHTESHKATVTVQIKPKDQRRIFMRLGELNQDSVTFESIPPGGTVAATFMIRIAGGEIKEPYPITVLLDGKQAGAVNLAPTFDRRQVFRLWVLRYLLLPPGASFIIPLTLLGLVSYTEWIGAKVARRRRENAGRPRIRMAVGAGILTLALCAFHCVMQSLVFTIVLSASVVIPVGIGAVLGCCNLIPAERDMEEGH